MSDKMVIERMPTEMLRQTIRETSKAIEALQRREGAIVKELDTRHRIDENRRERIRARTQVFHECGPGCSYCAQVEREESSND